MSKFIVQSVGPVTSIQDGGRFGVQRYGLAPSGAMDRIALAAANVLVGNAMFAAAIEVGPWGASFTACDGDVRISLTGAMRSADVGSGAAGFYQTILLHDGDTLKLGAARDGMFSYLAIEGGIVGEPVFGSLAVNARSGLGSPFPRPLQTGDALDVETAKPDRRERALDIAAPVNTPIRVVMGPQDDEFGEACGLFLQSEWRMSATRDRMGYRLEGPKIIHSGGHNIVSDGTVNGSIQVPGNGQPIVLMPDRGTTGGYPKIATVISADLGRFAQTPAGHTIRFESVNIEIAQTQARALNDLLQSLPGSVRDAAGSGLNLIALQEANLAGVAVSAIDTRTWQTEDIIQP